MKDSYCRAVDFTPLHVLARNPAVAVEGYWLDAQTYFYLQEDYCSETNLVTSTPVLFDAESGHLETAIEFDTLKALLSDHVQREVDLSDALLDMPARNVLAATVEGTHFLIDLSLRKVVSEDPVPEPACLYSPNRNYACFVNENDLWLHNRASGDQRPLTKDGTSNHSYGRDSESNLSAVSYRRRPTPMALWSADSEWVLTHRLDERSVRDVSLVQHAPPNDEGPVLHQFKYAYPVDAAVPMATFVAIHVETGRILSFDEHPSVVHGYSPLSYMYWMAWFGDADDAWYLRLDRYCKRADLVRLDLLGGSSEVILSETAESGYLEFHHLMSGRPNVRILSRTGEVLWFSERDGWGHLYIYDLKTRKLKRQVTHGDFMVRDIIEVDEDNRILYFTAHGFEPEIDPARRVFCRIPLDGGEVEILYRTDGDLAIPKSDHGGRPQYRAFRNTFARAGLSPSNRYASVRVSNPKTGNETRIVDLVGGAETVLASTGPIFGEASVQHFSALAADGVTRLHGVLFLPSDFDPSHKYPLLDYVYPGPQITWQPQAIGTVWGEFGRAMAELGAIVMMLDSRCMPFRSKALHQAGYGDLLEPQLSDHAAVIRQLCSGRPFLDPGRIGIIGQSGGGQAAARAMFEYPDLYRAGVAVCGNHDNRTNVSMWSDKY